MGYIHLFQTANEFNSARTDNYVEPWLSYTKETSGLSLNKTEYEKLLETPLTFEIISDGNIVWTANDTDYTCTIEYSKNGGEWTSITSSTAGTSFNVVSGDTIQFRGDNATYSLSSGTSKNNRFSGTTCGFKVKGNIMSLVNSTGFSTATTLASAYTFCRFFQRCGGLTDASNLVLPATVLTNYCYSSMFTACEALIATPELPATALTPYCYNQMFQRCTSLTNAPALPATTMVERCYNSIFSDCTSLTTVPKLPATILAKACYRNMFFNCSSLNTTPELSHITTLSELSCNQMFQGCINLTKVTSIGNSATTMGDSACTRMFHECTSLITAPELPATTLGERCYAGMFQGCTSLTTAPALPATTLADYCYFCMFTGCTGLITAPELPATTLTPHCYDSMFFVCPNLVNIPPMLSATTLAPYCYKAMFQCCSSITTAPELPATVLTEFCYAGMFSACTSLTSAPELPATTLASNSYNSIFEGCSNLNYIKCLATDISASNCTYNWVNGVVSTGTFVKNTSMASWTTGNNGIPTNWTVLDA